MRQLILAMLVSILATPFALAQSAGYRIQPGDILAITVLEDDTLEPRILVLPDGDLGAAGREPSGPRHDAGIRWRAPLPTGWPRISPSVRAFLSRWSTSPKKRKPSRSMYWVRSAIPGLREVEAGTTLLQAVALAGGLDRFAATKRIQLRRTDSSTGQEKLFLFNYNAVERGGSIQSMVTVREGDVIIVPERRLFE